MLAKRILLAKHFGQFVVDVKGPLESFILYMYWYAIVYWLLTYVRVRVSYVFTVKPGLSRRSRRKNQTFGSEFRLTHMNQI